MEKLDVYDFDGTLYSKDSSIQFYLYCIKRNPRIIKYIPKLIIYYILFIIKIIKKEKLKESFFEFLKKLNNTNQIVNSFWDKNKKHLRLELIKESKNKKIVISASPEFLLKDICKEIGIDKVIASKVSIKDGKFVSANCYGKEKINRLNKEYDNYKVVNFYSDSMSDSYLQEITEQGYYVKNNKIYNWNEQIDKYKKEMLNNIAYIYLIIPVIIFLLGWVKKLIAIPISVLLLISIIYRVHKCRYIKINLKDYLHNNYKKIIITLVITGLLIYLSGIGGLVYQNDDHVYRNAIFTELINNKWPIYLPKGGNFTKEVIMAYYFALWLPASIIGKLFGIKLGLISLYIWCFIGLYITFKYLPIYYKKNYLVPIVLFIGFSGLDIVEKFLYGSNILKIISSTAHIEWTTGYQFTAFTTQLFWVFNQSIPAWILTLIMLNENDNKRMLILISSSLIFSTLPTAGLMFILMYKMYLSENNRINIKYFIKRTKEAISFENIMIGIPLFIILASFIMSNSTSNKIYIGVPSYKILSVIITIIFEFLIYYYFIIKYNENKKLIVISLISLIICPFISINGGGDFCMRASIPGLIVLFILLLETLSKMNPKNNDYKIFIIIFILGAVTPLNEIRRTIKETNKETRMESIELITSRCQQNFYGYKDKSLFVKYFAKSK